MSAVVKKHWYDHIYFEFYVNVPLLTVQTRLLQQAYERMVYDICRIRVKFWKWSCEFQIYKRPSF